MVDSKVRKQPEPPCNDVNGMDSARKHPGEWRVNCIFFFFLLFVACEHCHHRYYRYCVWICVCARASIRLLDYSAAAQMKNAFGYWTKFNPFLIAERTTYARIRAHCCTRCRVVDWSRLPYPVCIDDEAVASVHRKCLVIELQRWDYLLFSGTMRWARRTKSICSKFPNVHVIRRRCHLFSLSANVHPDNHLLDDWGNKNKSPLWVQSEGTICRNKYTNLIGINQTFPPSKSMGRKITQELSSDYVRTSISSTTTTVETGEARRGQREKKTKQKK